ncbi:hypothetical protein DDJ72_09110 [Mycobacteroides abscessus]|nr:hypothetical protein DDJ72_09110 [Mycobacteroides abscessus]PVA97091.1 hypothetical protein DDK01_15730 [Mycobacteroides abscessus]TKV38862.1 hypothetical protein CFA71_18195 [Mycobacteroides abscessus subsp. bolletii]
MHLPTAGVVNEALEFHPIGHELASCQADALVQLFSVFTTEWNNNLHLLLYLLHFIHALTPLKDVVG